MSGNQQILANLIRARAATEPDLDVLTFVDVAADGSLVDEVRTYAQLWQNGQRIAAALKALGMKAGDTFAMVMDNHAGVRRPDGGLVHPRDDVRADRSAHAGRQARLHAGFRRMQRRGRRRRRARGRPRSLGRTCGPLDPAARTAAPQPLRPCAGSWAPTCPSPRSRSQARTPKPRCRSCTRPARPATRKPSSPATPGS